MMPGRLPFHWLGSVSLRLLLAALVSGGLAAWTAHGYLQDRTRQIEAMHRQPTVERVVAAHDLAPGTRIDASLLALRAYPAGLAPSDSLDAAQAAQLLGTVLASALRAGDIIVPAHTRRHSEGGFSSRIAQGRRAVSMPVDALNSVSGLLQPGDLIDLYVSFEHQRRRVTAPLLQGVLVLATGSATHRLDPDAASSGYGTITLDASPEDAVKLVAARQTGTITAMLRSPRDQQASQKAVRGDLAGLLGLSASPAPTRRNRPVVLYGNQSVRQPPALRPSPTVPAEQGVFDLPQLSVLASAWAQAMQLPGSAGSDAAHSMAQPGPAATRGPVVVMAPDDASDDASLDGAGMGMPSGASWMTTESSP